MTPIDTHSKSLLPWIIAFAFFMEMLDTTILNTSVPIIAKSLGTLPLSMKSVLSSYALSLAIFIPISSWVADKFGTRRVFTAAIGMFTTGSLLCGSATNLDELIGFRLLQGVGGAMMIPVGRLIIVRTFHKSELVQTMSFIAIPSLIGPLLGPLAGGLIVSYLPWRFIFFINVPIGLLGLYLANRHLPDYKKKNPDKLDVLGFILFGTGVGLLSYVLEVFGEHSLSSTQILSLAATACLLLVGYALHAIPMARPLLRFSLLHIRTLKIAVAGAFITRLAAGGLPFLLPLLFQVGLGYTPIQSGLIIAPQALGSLTLKFVIPKILTRIGYRRILIYNTVAMGFLIHAYSWIGINTSWIWIVALSLTYGFASSLQFTSMNTLVFADVKPDDTSQASTIVSTFQQMSMSFGIALSSLVAATFMPDGHHVDSAKFIQGIHSALAALGGFTIVSAAIFSTLKATDGADVSQHRSHGRS